MFRGRRIATVVATVVALSATMVAGCTGDNSVAPSLRSPATTLGEVYVSPLNAVMAVGDTMSLTVTARTLSGAPLTTFDSVQYQLQNSTDSLRVRLSPSGLITALSPSGANSPVLVQVIAFQDGLARANVAVVQVTATKFTGATLSIQPIAPDSARLAIGNDKTVNPVISNPLTGETVDGAAIRYEYGKGDSTTMLCYVPSFVVSPPLSSQQLTSSSCGANSVGLNQIHGNIADTAWVIANVQVYGVPLRDSVRYIITNTFVQYAQVEVNRLGLSGAGGNSFVIAPGGMMYFYNSLPTQLGATVDFVFDDPSAATVSNPPSDLGGTTGTITPLDPGMSATRQFLTAGTYRWVATVHGGIPPFAGATTTGYVIVK